MKKIYLLFAIHNHQPIGNSEEILEKAYELAYKPLLETFYNLADFKLAIHNSGILYQFYENKHPEYIDMLKEMVSRGQVEILTGGFYEPILPAIPDCDIIGQVEKMNDYIEKKFQYKPKGIWLTERIWETKLIKILNTLGITYTLVDDFHFKCAGLLKEEFTGYYLTESDGIPFYIFPISQNLRYFIPFATVEKTIEHILKFTSDTPRMLVAADDGEKFGLWPETHKHVYIDGWLPNFLKELTKNKDTIITMSFSEYTKHVPPDGIVYLPESSYFELSGWALPTDARESFERLLGNVTDEMRPFFRGGIWKNFLSKYPESNDMHKKMIYLSKKIQKLKIKTEQKKVVQQAQDKLFSAQCNCAYWHGIFGGLYLPHLRNALQEQLIECEKILDTIKKPSARFFEFDINYDGQQEIIFESEEQNIYIIPHRGGSIFWWDIKDKKINLLSILTRRKEAYHNKLLEYLQKKQEQTEGAIPLPDIIKVKEENLDKYLHYDWYRRLTLLDHFFHPHTSYDDFMKCKYGEQGDFVLGKYDYEITKNKLSLYRVGIVWHNEKSIKTKINKIIIPLKSGLEVKYLVQNLDEIPIDVIFAPELNLFLPKEIPNREIITDKWSYEDDNLKIELKLSESTTLYIIPIYTVSISEAGFEKIYQGVSITPVFKFSYSPNQTKDITLELNF